jgi:GcrA cell cycle regulator
MVHKVMTLEWTAKRTEKLAELWEAGISTIEIGRKLKVTKNAVVGKAHRLGLPQRQSPIPGKGKAPSKARGRVPPRGKTTSNVGAVKASAKSVAKSSAPVVKKGAGKAAKKTTVKPTKKARVKATTKSSVKQAKLAARKAPRKAPVKTAKKTAPKPVATKVVSAQTNAALGPVPTGTAHLVQIEAPRPPEAEIVRLEHLTSSMCCWPIGEPGTPAFRFCGKRPTVPDKPYCLEHCVRAYVKSSKDRRDSTPTPVPTPTNA